MCVCLFLSLKQGFDKKKTIHTSSKVIWAFKEIFYNKCACHETEIRLYIFEAIIESLLNLPQVEAFRTQ